MVLLGLLFGLLALSYLPSPNEPARREYEVYRDFLSEYQANKKTPATIVLRTHTQDAAHPPDPAGSVASLRSRLPKQKPEVALAPGLATSYIQESESQKSVDPVRLNLPISNTITESELEEMCAQVQPDACWGIFLDRFGPNAEIVGLSRVAFAEDEQQALVSISYNCGSLCGGGYLLLLERNEGRWVVAASSMLWIS